MTFSYLVTEPRSGLREHYGGSVKEQTPTFQQVLTSQPMSAGVTKNRVLCQQEEGVFQLSEAVPKVAPSQHKQRKKNEYL